MENIDHAAKIRAAIDAVFNPADYALGDFPDSEYWALSSGCGLSDKFDSSRLASSKEELVSTYSINVGIIRDMFDPKHYTNGQLTRELVMQRLALIDLFYSTNLNRYTQFGLYHLANVILTFRTDSALANDAHSFVNQPLPSHPIYTQLFNQAYSFPKTHAVSIISKYLFFLLEAQGCSTGFPIYDSMVKGLLPKVAKKLGLANTASGTKINGSNLDDIVKFVDCINTVAKAIDIQPRKHNGKHLSKFAVFDYFLWRIGKVGDFSYSLLLTENELGQAKVIDALKEIKKSIKDLTNKEMLSPAFISSILPEVAKLPARIFLWYRIYLYII